MRILILGGDGFCGWPTALHLSARGHDVVIVDNLSRRAIDIELEVQSLTPIRPHRRAHARPGARSSGREIDFRRIDVAQDYERLRDLLDELRPDAIVHFAEQRAAPYSMKSRAAQALHRRQQRQRHAQPARAMVEVGLDAHVVHLGTMGVYGYGRPGMQIPEGYLRGQGRHRRRQPGRAGDPLPGQSRAAIYHLTKTLDQLLFQFYAKNDGVRITDLHQGIVWGTQTARDRASTSG